VEAQKVLISLKEIKREIQGTISDIGQICSEINIDDLG